jgi:hypothetical protein
VPQNAVVFELLNSLRKVRSNVSTNIMEQVLPQLVTHAGVQSDNSGVRFDGRGGIIAGVSRDMFSVLAQEYVWQLNADLLSTRTGGSQLQSANTAVGSSLSSSGTTTNSEERNLYMNEDEECTPSDVHNSGLRTADILGALTPLQLATQLSNSGSEAAAVVHQLASEAKELFYQGQVLLLENMFTSARNKFLASAYLCLVVIHVEKAQNIEKAVPVTASSSSSRSATTSRVGTYAYRMLVAGLSNSSHCAATCSSTGSVAG